SRVIVANPADGGFFYWLLKFYVFGAVVLLAVVLASLPAVYVAVGSSVPAPPDLLAYEREAELESHILAPDGRILTTMAEKHRYLVRVDQVPPLLVQAFLAAEDRDFFAHGGVDFKGILRAAWANLQAGSVQQGGSTITQQVAKAYLTPERTIQRKLKEVVLARRIEARFTKPEILYLYLNHIFFGAQAYGVKAAARVYFDKDLSELTLGEMAMMAGLVRAPSRYSPRSSKARALRRRDQVLDAMLASGFIDRAAREAARRESIDLAPASSDPMADVAPHFTEHVRRLLNQRYGKKRVYTSGWRVETTVDLPLHALARDPAVADSWRSLAARARVEEHRLRLEAMPPEDRQARGGAYDGLLQEGAAREFLAELLAEPSCRKFSPTTLETYVACPMRWFLARMLGLSEPREPGWDLERSEEGSWVHETLARFFAPSEFDPTWDQAAQTERLGRCLNQAREDLAGQGRAGHGQVQESRHQVLARTLGQVVAREMADMAALRPSRVEAEFGKDDPGLRVDMEQGDPLFLHGRLDRLDQAPGMLRVVDYKHVSQPGKVTGPLKKEDLGVSAFQMPVYLAAARELWGKADDAMSARVAPTRKIEQKPLQGEFQPGDPFLAVDTATRRELAAVGQPNLFNGIADLWSRLQDGNFMPLPQKKACEYCPMSGVCRARVSPAAALEGEQS
ncbi:MAG: transglycosylase domain-containing protein, partial [Proteobacteria bacterium]|nr:transglycosylase domain-containing protein [Pseudomonadota bacterium]